MNRQLHDLIYKEDNDIQNGVGAWGIGDVHNNDAGAPSGEIELEQLD